MTASSNEDENFVRLGDVVVRIARAVRAKRRGQAASLGRVVELDAAPLSDERATIAALAVLADARIIDAGTGARLLKRALADAGPEVREDDRAPIEPP